MEENRAINTLLPIGKMAEINHVSIAALRHYDHLGLLKPVYINPETGYRYYSIDQNARLDMIAYMKELGMSLAEVRNVFEKEDISLIESILARKNEQFHREMLDLKRRHDTVERAIASIERYRKSPVTGVPALEYIGHRYIWPIPCSENFYDTPDISGYERVLWNLRQDLMNHGITNIHSYNNGTSISQRDYLEGKLIADKVFAFLDHTMANNWKEIKLVESSMYACIYADRYEDEIPCAQKLLYYCKEQGYQISGDYICEIMTEFNVFSSESRSMFMRLQVPVQFPSTSTH